MFLGEIFQTQTQTIDGWPDPSHKKLTRPDPGQNFGPGPITSLLRVSEVEQALRGLVGSG